MTHYYDPATVDASINGKRFTIEPSGFIRVSPNHVYDQMKRSWARYFAAVHGRTGDTPAERARHNRLLELALTKGRYWIRRLERDEQRKNRFARASAKLLPKLLRGYRR